MPKTFASIMLATILAAGSAFGQSTDDEKAVLSTFGEIVNDVNSGNPDDFLARVTDDVMFLEMIPTEPPAVGKEAVGKMARTIMAAYDFTWNGIETDTVIVVDDLAFHHYTGVFFATPKEGGETSRSERRYLDIFRRQSDGDWKLSQHTIVYLSNGD